MASRLFPWLRVPAHNARVSYIGAPEQVEHIAGEGNRAYRGFHRDVADHPRDRAFRQLQPVRLIDEVGRKRGAAEIADHRQQTQQRIEAEADFRAGYPVSGVEKPGQSLYPG